MRLGDCVTVFEKQLIKSLIHPPEWGGLGGIKKVADTGRVASGSRTEVEGGQGVASGRVIQEVSKQGGENRYQNGLISRLSRGEEGRAGRSC